MASQAMLLAARGRLKHRITAGTGSRYFCGEPEVDVRSFGHTDARLNFPDANTLTIEDFALA